MDKREANRAKNARWRAKNPEKVAALNKRANELKRAKRAAFLAANPPPTPEERAARAKEKQREYNRRYRQANRDKMRENSKIYWETHKNDPVFRARSIERKRKYYRLKHGLPPDAPVSHRGRKYATEEERLAARRESKRLAAARKRAAVSAEKKQRPAEDPAKRAQRAAEQRAAKARAEKRAAPMVRTKKQAPAPVNTNDPPELVELFRKASKGEPLRPYNPKGRKVSVFAFRGSIIQPRRI